MKLILSQAPFIRVTIPLILGIILSVFVTYFSVNIIILIIISLVFALISNLLFNKRIKLKDIIFNFLVFIIFASLGYGITEIKIDKLQKYNDSGIFLVQTIESPQVKNTSVKLTCKLIAKKDSSNFSKLNNEKVILFLKNDSNYLPPNYNDFIIIKANIKQIDSPKNPEQFNYKKYLYYKDILNGAYVKQGAWRVIENKGFSIYRFANDIRNLLISKLSLFNINGKNKAIISAISLGKRDDIDSYTNEQFSNAGVMHILAVSGMHVGIVFLILISIFKPFMRLKKGKVIIYISIVIILWIYALITGLTPSVVRAVLMFSLVSIGKAFDKSHNVYNTIFASAFILLLIDPFYIFQVGFQLSYLAVIGIIFFQPKIASLIKTNNRLFNYFWGIVSVSLAAQLATAPITLLYFHKFPVYFLISNIAVMLNVSVILIVSFVFFATYYIPYVNEFFAKILDYSTYALNFSVEEVNKLPYPIIDNINWNILYTLLSYAIILLASFYLIKRNKYIFSSFIFLLFILFFFLNYTHYVNSINKEISFFSINKHAIIGFTANNKTSLLIDKNYKNLKKDIKFNVADYITNNGSVINKTGLINYIKKDQKYNLYRRNNFIKYFDKSIYVYNGEKIYDTTKTINLDYLVIQKYKYWNFDNVLTKFKPKNIILSSTLWPNNIKKLDSIFNTQNNINIIDLNKKAYVEKLK